MRRAAIVLALLAGCRPEPGEAPSLVRGVRVLAVRGEPAEAAPGERVTWRVLLAGPDGTPAAPAQWALCSFPRPLSEPNAVAAACGIDDTRVIAQAATEASAALPADVCQLFGPDTPPGSTGLRPRDPDVTGGYYQPVRVTVGGTVAYGFQRIRCNLASAAVDLAREFDARYQRNQNPTLTVAPPPVAAPGTTLALTARWPAEAAENYVYFDGRALVLRREALRVSWFASAGAFAADRTGAAEDDPATVSDNTWTAPDTPGVVHFWVVLRDGRGGTAFTTFDVDVR